MAKRLSNPLTRLGTLENFWLKASEMLWAGSVEMIKTDSRTLDRRTERLQLQIMKKITVKIVKIWIPQMSS